MALFGRKKSKIDDKKIKEIINENIATSMKTQRPFSQLLMLNGCPMRKVGRMGSKIRKQLLKEAKNGDLTVETVMPRAYELIGEYLGISEVKIFEDMAIENNASRIENTKPRFCGNCGNTISEDSKFCSNCGNKLINESIECLQCGEINEPDSKFCINCGNDLKKANKPTREEFEKQSNKIKEKINSKDLVTISIGGKTIGNNKIEKDNPNLGKKDVKFKSMDYGLDIGKQLNQKIDDIIIENYGTKEEKAELEARKDKEKEKIQKQKPIRATFEKADKLFMRHEHKKAIPEFRYVIDNSEVYNEIVSLSYTFLSDCYVFLHDYDSAISVLNEHLEVKKEFNEDYQEIESQLERVKQFEIDYKVKGLKQDGVKLFYRGKFDEAIPLFKECIDLNCDDGQIYNLLASIYIRNRDFKSAKGVLEKAVENVSWEQSLHNEHNTGLADRLEKVNNYLETGNLVGEPLPFDSDFMKSEIKNAKKVLKEEDKDEGVQLLENIIKKGTYTNTTYYTLYQTYMKDKKYDDAIRISDLAIETLGLFDQDRLEKWTKYKYKATTKIK